jgi:stearoyl-CoA desaturase (delta-9 desaturase)
MESTLPMASPWRIKFRVNTLLFLGVHLAALGGVIALGPSWRGVGWALGAYYVRMIVVTATYHRYFSHRAYKTSRAFQFLLALGAQSAAQNGVLWWASHHRFHHRHSDTPRDIHSVKQRGFWYAHWGWILCNDWNKTDARMVQDLHAHRELRFLNHPWIHALPTVALALGFLAVGGMPGLIWGYFVSTVLLWHGSFAINSLAHRIGKRRYDTPDDSRNNWFLALLMTGEGWHNNHHYFPGAARQGFRWYEIDVTYACLWLLSLTGLIWDLRPPPAERP